MKKKKKKREFSKIAVVVSWLITSMWITYSYLLSTAALWLQVTDFDPNSSVTGLLVTESFAVTISYFVYQASLKTSRNKHGIDSDGVPFIIKQKLGEKVFNENYGGLNESSSINESEIGEVSQDMTLEDSVTEDSMSEK